MQLPPLRLRHPPTGGLELPHRRGVSPGAGEGGLDRAGGSPGQPVLRAAGAGAGAAAVLTRAPQGVT